MGTYGWVSSASAPWGSARCLTSDLPDVGIPRYAQDLLVARSDDASLEEQIRVEALISECLRHGGHDGCEFVVSDARGAVEQRRVSQQDVHERHREVRSVLAQDGVDRAGIAEARQRQFRQRTRSLGRCLRAAGSR